MSSVSPQEIKSEFLRSKIGIAGISILAVLILVSIVAIVAIPNETFSQWNNPGNWISYPKVAIPVWVNLFLSEKIPEHKILDDPIEKTETSGDISLVSHQFGINFAYDDFPNDFIYEFSAQYSGTPLLEMIVVRPDGTELKLLSTSLPYSESTTKHTERIFSTDESIRKNLFLQSDKFDFSLNRLSAEDVVFSQMGSHQPLKGDYSFMVNLYGVNSKNEISDSTLIVGGKAFGIMGTDELRRDLAVGLLWGTPLALFIGIVVAIASVALGLLYGVYAGYRGKKTDEVMMRFNDVIYALPALPFLIILSVT
ncbi:MAG: ABC transporter permease, partial [Nitrosopumilaceae archaeon]